MYPDSIETDETAENIIRNNPHILDFINNWRIYELENLPDRMDNVTLGQGRCQVLKELCRYMEKVLAKK